MGLGLTLLTLGGLLAVGAAVVMLRSRATTKALERQEEDQAIPPPLPRSQPPPPDEGPRARHCPVCLNEYWGEFRFCAVDGAELKEGAARSSFVPGLICPTCRRGYPSDATFCPEDLDELIPYGLYGAAAQKQPPQRLAAGKICPECGDRYATAQTFCVRDGAVLVVVN